MNKISFKNEYQHSVERKSSILDSFVRGFHVYMDILDSKVGDEDILLEPEENNEYDEFAVGVLFESNSWACTEKF